MFYVLLDLIVASYVFILSFDPNSMLYEYKLLNSILICSILIINLSKFYNDYKT
jgi:hypothetical protein